MKEKKIEKKDFYLVVSDQTIAFVLSYYNLHLFHYFFLFFYFISLFTLFLLFMILFTVFYSWMMLEILQILLLMSYKLVYYQSQKIISNIYSLYFLSNSNHVLIPSVYKFFSSYELVIFVYLF